MSDGILTFVRHEAKTPRETHPTALFMQVERVGKGKRGVNGLNRRKERERPSENTVFDVLLLGTPL